MQPSFIVLAVKYLKMFVKNSIAERRLNYDYNEKLVIDSLIEYQNIDMDEV